MIYKDICTHTNILHNIYIHVYPHMYTHKYKYIHTNSHIVHTHTRDIHLLTHYRERNNAYTHI